MAKLNTQQIWKEWQKFRKDFSALIQRDNLMQINLEFDLDDYFCDKDMREMSQFCDKVKIQLTNIREGLK